MRGVFLFMAVMLVGLGFANLARGNTVIAVAMALCSFGTLAAAMRRPTSTRRGDR
jgi:hypothetical protein